MSLSNPGVADLINDSFEPAWQSVRDVPIVTIEFGDGHVVRRTLHGNIATYLCASDGAVIDVIPGLYDATTYRERLEEAADLAERYADWPGDERVARLREHHGRASRGPGAISTLRNISSSQSQFKGSVERPVESVIAASPSAAQGPFGPPGVQSDLLAADTRHNETVRRPAILAMLAGPGSHTPEELTRRVYREVLNTDLDDPYLGLGETLFGSYPFAR